MLRFFDIAEPDDVNVVRVRVTEDYTIQRFRTGLVRCKIYLNRADIARYYSYGEITTMQEGDISSPRSSTFEEFQLESQSSFLVYGHIVNELATHIGPLYPDEIALYPLIPYHHAVYDTDVTKGDVVGI